MSRKESFKVECKFDEMVSTELLKTHPKNSRKHPRNQLILIRQIIEGNGWRNPIVVSRQSGYITKGHGRLATARMAGWDQVPVEYQDYATEELEVADMLADNLIGDKGETDKDRLKEVVKQEMVNWSINVELSGLSKEEVEKMLGINVEEEGQPMYDITPRLHEKYDYVVIMSDNISNTNYLFDYLGLKSVSDYRNITKVGQGRIIWFKDFMKRILKDANNNNEQGESPVDNESSDIS